METLRIGGTERDAPDSVCRRKSNVCGCTFGKIIPILLPKFLEFIFLKFSYCRQVKNLRLTSLTFGGFPANWSKSVLSAVLSVKRTRTGVRLSDTCEHLRQRIFTLATALGTHTSALCARQHRFLSPLCGQADGQAALDSRSRRRGAPREIVEGAGCEQMCCGAGA